MAYHIFIAPPAGEPSIPAVSVFLRRSRLNNDVLWTERQDGKGWCLPGGMINPGETPVLAAKRETLEEVAFSPYLLSPLVRWWVKYDDESHCSLHYLYEAFLQDGQTPGLSDEVTALQWGAVPPLYEVLTDMACYFSDLGAWYFESRKVPWVS